MCFGIKGNGGGRYAGFSVSGFVRGGYGVGEESVKLGELTGLMMFLP